MLVPTDLNRAGVLRVVQQPHSAVAFPVQTPDAAAHQSAQHLLDRLCAGPGRRARSTYIQVGSSVTLTTSLFCGPTPGQRQRLCGAAAVVHRLMSVCARAEPAEVQHGACVQSVRSGNSATAAAAALSPVRLDCHPSPHLLPPVSSPLPCRSKRCWAG